MAASAALVCLLGCRLADRSRPPRTIGGADVPGGDEDAGAGDVAPDTPDPYHDAPDRPAIRGCNPPVLFRDARADDAPEVPPVPDREAVRRVFEEARRVISDCLERVERDVREVAVEIVIRGSTGRIIRTWVSIDAGGFSPEQVGCLRYALADLVFPLFGQPTLTVRYIYRF